MSTTSATIATLGLVLTGSVLTGCAADARGAATTGSTDDTAPIVELAQAYVGDPWEKRFRQQFWADQHVHDSWNPCHIGENVPKPLQGRGPSCWSRLKSHTGR